VIIDEFQIIVEDRVDLWNDRMPDFRVWCADSSFGVKLYCGQCLDCSYPIKAFTFRPKYWDLDAYNAAEYGQILDDLVDVLEGYFGVKELGDKGGKAMPMFTISEIIAKINEMYGEYGAFTLKTEVNKDGVPARWLWFKASVDHYGVQPGPNEVGVGIDLGIKYMSERRAHAWSLIKDYERHVLEAHSTEAGNRSAYYRVIFNDPATIVLWRDGTKTVVKCRPGEEYDPEKGLAMCIAKKTLGNKGNYYELFKDHLTDYYIAEGLKELNK
jgi:hypothetical protein